MGDKVFVEGIVNILNLGDGFNSADNKYNFYDVIAYSNTNPAKLVFDASQFVQQMELQLLLKILCILSKKLIIQCSELHRQQEHLLKVKSIYKSW